LFTIRFAQLSFDIYVIITLLYIIEPKGIGVPVAPASKMLSDDDVNVPDLVFLSPGTNAAIITSSAPTAGPLASDASQSANEPTKIPHSPKMNENAPQVCLHLI
jgi:hypothetical protein